MLNNRKVVLDSFCEVYDLLKPLADIEFSNLNNHDYITDAIYVISRENFNLNISRLRELAEKNIIHIVLCNPMEGSETLIEHCKYQHKIFDLVEQHKIWLISGGALEKKYPYILYDDFLPKILDYEENIKEIELAKEIYVKTEKPYKFLFLNGRLRHHRRYLLEKFRYDGILDNSLWTNLEDQPTIFNPFVLPAETNIYSYIPTTFPMQSLPTKYEVDRYSDQAHIPPVNTTQDLFFKYHLFKQEWGDIYLKATPYIDTYFSVVTETIFEYPYSFRTEKTWKPVAIGHPFIFVSNYGYYRDFKNLGFRTFGHLIDERFDMIENVQDRIVRISEVVKDLCRQDLPAFLAAAEETCKYNQQHLAEMRTKVRQEFPQRFVNFINERSRIS